MHCAATSVSPKVGERLLSRSAIVHCAATSVSPKGGERLLSRSAIVHCAATSVSPNPVRRPLTRFFGRCHHTLVECRLLVTQCLKEDTEPVGYILRNRLLSPSA